MQTSYMTARLADESLMLIRRGELYGRAHDTRRHRHLRRVRRPLHTEREERVRAPSTWHAAPLQSLPVRRQSDTGGDCRGSGMVARAIHARRAARLAAVVSAPPPSASGGSSARTTTSARATTRTAPVRREDDALRLCARPLWWHTTRSRCTRPGCEQPRTQARRERTGGGWSAASREL
jgi:hypothetical protein